MELAPLVMSCGDPSGIGPEIALKAWQALGGECPFVWLGDPRHLPAGTEFTLVETPAAASGTDFAVMDIAFAAPARPGQPDPANGAGVIAAIRQGVALVQGGTASGLVTCPINKAALKTGAGFAFPGHTEFLAHLAGGADVVMMLACDALRVVPVTIHIPLSDVPASLTQDLLERSLRITHAALQRDFGLVTPRLAVAGLNPHAGENGVMGQEEITVISPVLDRLRAEGMVISGPLSADTMFHAGARARYDAAIAMYHDQALIPIKTIDFAGGVNVTLGLPFIRTSPDHGTAYDITGQNKADPTSLIAALRMARTMAERRAA
ncbi:4-hydroxythreonine-4-phosphate dehydrogenase PdxA [Roseinatronobacter alkalisoli]|uniref:4-hydroxythreonine-4-phosphate dehydrogenase n=1 Tax=Roseinatronobacter alkalisoli TaxID=3028235 RepID=A0ABT5T6G4_9RHOB|nr:4-hydroxythreonine-4-phosphate dehydrogenase PdxA [Roseinatronobacter sp. HJB301]MDD7970534.1 4-hydroxythreonine-4-phosphate dehydrogenase PdxA [Roseinatronobacter sp. HJB301]